MYFYILYKSLTCKMRLSLNNPTVTFTVSIKIQLHVSLRLCFSKYRESSFS